MNDENDNKKMISTLRDIKNIVDNNDLDYIGTFAKKVPEGHLVVGIKKGACFNDHEVKNMNKKLGRKRFFEDPLNVRITFLVTERQLEKLQLELIDLQSNLSISEYCRAKVLGVDK